MLKQLLIIFFILINYTTNSAFAQDSTKTKHSKWGIGVRLNTVEQTQRYSNQTGNIYWQDDVDLYFNGYHSRTKDNSFAIGIIGNYYLKNSNFLRCNIGINKIDVESNEEYLAPWGDNALFNASKKQNDLHFAFGTGWKIDKEKLSFYGGFVVVAAFYGKAFVHKYVENQVPNGIFYNSNEVTGTIENGYSYGIGNFLGFAYNIKKISIGGEIAYSFLYSKYGGKETFYHMNIQVNPPEPNIVTETTAIFDNVLTIFEMSKVKPSIYFTYNF